MTTIDYKIERCATLLAQSLLDEEIKKLISENMEKFTEEDLDKIITSLERETIELTALEEVLQKFDKTQDTDWKKLEEKQKAAAKSAIDAALADALGSSLKS